MGLLKAVKIHNCFCTWFLAWVGALAPTFALGYAISTSSPESSHAALDILKKGGNAADAVVAAAFALGVSRPQMTGIGGGGIALMWTPKVGVWVDEHREEAPGWVPPNLLLDALGKPIPYWTERVTGPKWVGIPGFIKGYSNLHSHFGLLPWKKLLRPAISYAKDGVPMTDFMARDLAKHWERLKPYTISAHQFGKNRGTEPLQKGDRLVQKDLSKTLETVASQGALSFYQGPFAEKWLREAHSLGVKIESHELAQYQSRQPSRIFFPLETFGLMGYTAPPPSSSGFTVAGALRYLAQRYRKHSLPPPLSLPRLVSTTETMATFQHLCQLKVGDLCTQSQIKTFFGSELEHKVWEEIDNRIANRLAKIATDGKIHKGLVEEDCSCGDENSQERLEGHTAHIVVVDEQGLVASATSSIEQFYGSGLVVPGAGFLLNNELSDFNPQPGGVNSPQAGARPRSNMSPMILTQKDKISGKEIPVLAVGCAGGPRIPSAVLQFLENHLIFRLSPQEASRLPRFHIDNKNCLLVENKVELEVVQELKKMGYSVEVIDRLPTVLQAAVYESQSKTWVATTDPRYDGLALSGSL